MAKCRFLVSNCLVVLCALAVTPALAIINTRFTPLHLVRQSETILAGTIQPAARPGEWRLADVEAIKGKAEREPVFGLAIGDDGTRVDVQKLLSREGKMPALFFDATEDGEKKAHLHVDGMWLALEARQPGRWDIQGFAQTMDGTYAGGTDMLARMARYIHANPDASVPTSTGTHWSDRSRVAALDGPGGATAGLPSRVPPPGTVGQADRGTESDVCGMAAVELKGDKTACLFVASTKGDRLFRPKDGEDAMQDVTAEAKVDTRSRRFAWIDVDRDGLADLVSWDGRAITVRLARQDGTFASADPARTFALGEECLGLAPIGLSAGGAPAILVSTRGRPFILDPGGKRAELPPGPLGETNGPPAACIVADLDNDGFVDVLQPRADGGVLWRGGLAPRSSSNGVPVPFFGRPVRSRVACPGGEAVFALGDFDGDGFLDLFASDKRENQLWENDGKAGFRPVVSQAGSLSYRCPPGASALLATDLNHDGRTDLGIGYVDSSLVYHFNRGFRCLGEDVGLRLVGPEFQDGPADAGVRALAAADFNGDGSLDLAVAFASAEAFVYYNALTDMPGLRIRLPKGVAGPVTVSAWQEERVPICVGTCSVVGHAPATFVPLRRPGPCVLKYRFQGKPSQSKKVRAGAEVKEVVLEE